MMVKDIKYTLKLIPKFVIYTPQRDDEHTRPFHMGVPPEGQ